jgi:CubicO group peptidase (beta-lactamase class C family)
MKNLAILLLCVLLQPGLVGQKGFVKDGLGEKLDDLMTDFSKEGYSGAALVARDGEIILRKGYGLADRERKIQNTPATLFHVASVGKIFTAAAILQLEMRGKLKTSDFISKYLGQFPQEKSGATIHHLLSHTAGLIPEGAPLKYESRRAFVQSVKDAPLESKPGEKYRYSNAGYVLLAAIVEEVSGQPFETYLQANIFNPAGLTSTGYAWDKRFDNAPVAVGYKGDNLESLRPTPRVTDIWGNRGPGNLITTVEDLYEWIKSLHENLVLSEQAKKKMFTAYANSSEGYGWNVIKTPRNTTMVRRGGGREDFESEVRWYTDENIVVIFTVNNDLNFRRRIAPAIEKTIWQSVSERT